MDNSVEKEVSPINSSLHLNTKNILTKLLSREFLSIYFIFFVYFLIFSLIDIDGSLYFTEIGNLEYISFIKILGNISISVLPFLLIRLNKRIGNHWVVRIGIFLLAIAGTLLFLNSSMITIYLFSFSIVSRFINTGLNPYIIKKVKDTEGLQKSLSKAFSFRDFFLYAGAALGTFIGSILKKIGANDLFIFQISTGFIALLIIFSLFILQPMKISNEDKVEQPKSQKIKFKEIQNKKYLIVLLLISSLVEFIMAVSIYIPTISKFNGLKDYEILSSYTIGYIFVGILSIVLAFITPHSKKKTIFLFDLIFDVIPLGLILFSRDNLVLVVFAIMLLIARDFVRPISLDYIFSLFNSEEIDQVWALLGVIPSIASILFLFIIIPMMNSKWEVAVIIAMGISVLVTIIAIFLLPNLKEKKSSDSIK